jgi:hypothetical protein
MTPSRTSGKGVVVLASAAQKISRCSQWRHRGMCHYQEINVFTLQEKRWLARCSRFLLVSFVRIFDWSAT